MTVGAAKLWRPARKSEEGDSPVKCAYWAKGFALVLAAFLLASCAGGGGPSVSEQNWQYTLDSGDEVKIVVFGEQDLSDTYRVSDGGAISMPLLGQVPVRGKTTHALEMDLAKRLSNGFLRNPNVRVEMVSYRPVYILGEVQNPGKYSYEPGMTALSAVAVAGGFTYRADTKGFKVTRKFNDGHTDTGSVKPDDPIFPGDIIDVGERLF
jgi:polysaccharide export outer membrane protein